MSQGLKLGLILTIGIVVISSSSILVRWAQYGGAPSLVIAAYRLATATCILSIPLIRQRGWQDYAKLNRQTILLLVLGGVLLGFHFATWITSLTYVSVMSSVVLVSTTPIWIGLASPLLLSERISRVMWASLLTAMVGAGIIGIAGWKGIQTHALAGDVLALGGAVFAAGYLVIGRKVRTTISLVPYLWIVYGTAAAFLLVWSLAARLPLTGYPLAATLCMLALGIGPQLIGHSSANYAVRHLSATFVSITILGEPIGSTLLAFVLLKETPSVLQILGGLLTLVGIVSASLAEGKATAESRIIASDNSPKGYQHMVKITCFKCHWSWSLNADGVRAALDSLSAEDSYYAVECPKCRRINKITRKQLEHALPRPAAQPTTPEQNT